MPDPSDQLRIDALVGDFFAAFDNRNGRIPTADGLLPLFADKAVVAKHDNGQCALYSPAEFVAPRIALLKSGELTGFHEWEVSETTEILGSLAVRNSRYSKSGLFNAASYSGSGTKRFQLARLSSGWKIVALSWMDDA